MPQQKLVSLIPVYGDVYLLQHYVIKFVSDLIISVILLQSILLQKGEKHLLPHITDKLDDIALNQVHIAMMGNQTYQL
jgi:hypothetical protein